MKVTLTHAELQQAVAQWAREKTGQEFMDGSAVLERNKNEETTWFTAEIETDGDLA